MNFETPQIFEPHNGNVSNVNWISYQLKNWIQAPHNRDCVKRYLEQQETGSQMGKIQQKTQDSEKIKILVYPANKGRTNVHKSEDKK